MAISVPNLKAAIKAAFDAEKEKSDNQQDSIDNIAGAIASAVAKEIAAGIDGATIVHVLAAPPAGGTVTGEITITATINQ